MGDFSQERLLALFTQAPDAFWRHDVDVSLAAARKMAEMAQIGGVVSTFYLNPRSSFYNLFSGEGRATVRHILAAGHRVGVHVDPIGDPEESALNDLQLVSSWYGEITFGRRVSFHMPNSLVLWRDFGHFENAYASKWEGRYLADSRGKPLNGNVTNDMQINLHPEHWFSAPSRADLPLGS